MYVILIENEDFELSDGSSLVQSFPAGVVNGSLCVSTTALNDSLVEGQETYLVSVNSNDSSVTIMDEVAQITIAHLPVARPEFVPLHHDYGSG